jgi:hypothetical protein
MKIDNPITILRNETYQISGAIFKHDFKLCQVPKVKRDQVCNSRWHLHLDFPAFQMHSFFVHFNHEEKSLEKVFQFPVIKIRTNCNKDLELKMEHNEYGPLPCPGLTVKFIGMKGTI